MISAHVTSAYPRTTIEKRPSFSAAAIVIINLSAVIFQAEKAVIVIFSAVCIFAYNIPATFIGGTLFYSTSTDSTSTAVATQTKITAEIIHIYSSEIDFADRFSPIRILN